VFGVVMALEIIVLKNKYKKTLLIVILKKIGLKIMYLIKIILIWISAYNINKKQVFINEKWIILIFIKPRFETQIYMESSIKKHKIFY